ncbi:MAG: DMT family transporter [Deltaproteobacteria bacterium]|nr:DMT family transporter [Deltaproteobacteria bacterium]
MGQAFPGFGEACSALCALVWAFAVILFRKSGDHFPPVVLNLFKGLVGLSMMLVTLPLVGVDYVPAGTTAGDWGILLLSGTLGIGVADSLFFASLNRIGAGRFAVIDSLYSPSVIFWSLLLLSEPLGPMLPVAVALMGAATVIGSWRPEEATRAHDRRDAWTGILLGVAAVVIMAFGIVLAKPALDRTDPWWATTVRLVGGVAFLAVQGMTPAHRAATLAALRPGPAWRVAIPGSVLGAWLSMLLWVFGMKYTYTTTASVLNQTTNMWVILLAAVFLREPLRARHYLAVALGFGAGWLATVA